ncbi:MAG: hypothetical protein HY788_01370 [Deltaproteobacteria bacterium]|nr:hypothetical protein [Deltaproteobacteria bacterium]
MSSNDTVLEEKYLEAVKDAMTTEEGELYDGLTDVVEANHYLHWSDINGEIRVLAVTWTPYPDSYPVGETVQTWWGDTWVTMAPEITDWFSENYRGNTDMTLRAAQLLGLPKDAGYTHFVELWVRPGDLFRPAPDNEITDRTVQLELPESAEEWYIEWFHTNIIDSYFPMQYPWTRLGYTYDWGAVDTEVGLSEFVIRQGSEVIVESNAATEAYLRSN